VRKGLGGAKRARRARDQRRKKVITCHNELASAVEPPIGFVPQTLPLTLPHSPRVAASMRRRWGRARHTRRIARAMTSMRHVCISSLEPTSLCVMTIARIDACVRAAITLMIASPAMSRQRLSEQGPAVQEGSEVVKALKERKILSL